MIFWGMAPTNRQKRSVAKSNGMLSFFWGGNDLCVVPREIYHSIGMTRGSNPAHTVKICAPLRRADNIRPMGNHIVFACKNVNYL